MRPITPEVGGTVDSQSMPVTAAKISVVSEVAGRAMKMAVASDRAK